MRQLLATIEPAKTSNARARITDAMREMLKYGHLKEGDRLPASQELSQLWDVPEPTVHRALTVLVKEGFLERTPKVGTFVKQRSNQLARVGIYTDESVWRDSSSHLFSRAVFGELLDQLGDAGIETSIWTDPRPKAELGDPWPELERAAEQRRLQLLVVPCSDVQRIEALRKLPVPVVFLSGAKIRNRVTLDQDMWAKHSLNLLAAQGCRRIGAICSVFHSEDSGVGNPYDSSLMVKTLQKEASRLGLDLRPDWIMRPRSPIKQSKKWRSEFGFESLTTLARLSDRPEGLVVYEDVTAAGVLMAMMREQAPGEVLFKLALHRNAEIGLFCPVPAAFVDLHVKEVAAALVTQAHRMYAGERVAPIMVEPHPVPVSISDEGQWADRSFPLGSREPEEAGHAG